MDTANPMDGRRQCTASARSGERCKRRPIVGGMVCPMHGGKAPQVKAAAAVRVADMLADAIDPNRALREAGRVAYSDIRKLYGPDGRLLPKHEWPDDIAACVASLEEDTIQGNVDKGDGQFDKIVKTRVRLWDKNQAAERLFRHLGMLEERLSVTLTIGLDQKLIAARKRLGE